MDSGLPQQLLEMGYINELAEKTARRILSIANYPEFPPKGVPVKVAADVYGKSELWVRENMLNGTLKIGYITFSEGSSKKNVYISPKKLWEDTGYIWDGRTSL